MKKIKSVTWDEVRADLMSDPEVQAAMEAEERKERLQAMLAQWRHHAGLTRAQVAERMGVTPPTVSRMEANISRASLETVARYARACGIEHPQIML
ncbi:helix-turn-helix domain-containing protein [Citrobacter werkmanii]|jgi:DNA-binding XRE family transcriptional regulator|uniref:helix-turn-helix domain-containing protein n=1 Tax=Citrobacter sp. TaxID=1896336 RepID=UPI0028FE31AA|nr:helix-turn-helix domain-containing protein [Citrobacter sp.]MDU1874313.1 helix-turn-helix domain-containing protein [Citrobacter sp.]